MHKSALLALKDKIVRFISSETPLLVDFREVCKELEEKRISYTGEEISRPHSLSVEQILKSVPPVGHGGAIPVGPFLKGRIRRSRSVTVRGPP